MGRVTGPYGVRGWIKVRPFTETAEGLVAHAKWWVGREGEWREVTVADAAAHSGQVVALLEGLADRERAAALKGMEVAVPRDAFPETDEGEYYWADLIGLKVANLQGDELGEVAEVFSNGAQDVLRVVEGGRERLIPFVAAVVGRVDLADARIEVDWGKDW
jgi:16S rRNA processing protein RimM